MPTRATSARLLAPASASDATRSHARIPHQRQPTDYTPTTNGGNSSWKKKSWYGLPSLPWKAEENNVKLYHYPEATRRKDSIVLTRVANDVSLDTVGKVETLFLTTLSRKPTVEEARRSTRYVDSGGPYKDSKQALSDVFRALFNSAEFNLNH